MSAYNEGDAFLCACKGEPYTLPEWVAECERLQARLLDACKRRDEAMRDGCCLPERFDERASASAAKRSD